MHSRSLAVILAAAALIAAGAAQAQQPQKPNPMDVIPDAMPFATPYGVPISAERAEQVIAAAKAEATKRHWAMNITVLDSGGNLVAFERMDGAQLASIEISQHKARTAVRYRRETKAFEAGLQAGNNYLLTLDDVMGSRGGIPLIVDGKIIGSIGCSGGTGSQDEAVAKAGAASVSS